jgi:hypothetical protein
MRTKCSIQSVVTFEELGLVLQVSRRDRWAMVAHLASGESLGIFIRYAGKLTWEPKEDFGNLPTEVWTTIATMI